MKYYAFFDEIGFFATTPISIKKGPDYDLYLPRLAKEISYDQFLAYKNIGIPEEQPFEELAISTNFSDLEMETFYYYYYHSKVIYYLINNCNCKYSWEDVIEWDCVNPDEQFVISDMSKNDTNPFFRNTVNEKDKLGK